MFEPRGDVCLKLVTALSLCMPFVAVLACLCVTGRGVYSLEAAVLLLLHYSQSWLVPEKERLSREVSGTCCLMKQERPRRVLFNEHWRETGRDDLELGWKSKSQQWRKKSWGRECWTGESWRWRTLWFLWSSKASFQCFPPGRGACFLPQVSGYGRQIGDSGYEEEPPVCLKQFSTFCYFLSGLGYFQTFPVGKGWQEGSVVM